MFPSLVPPLMSIVSATRIMYPLVELFPAILSELNLKYIAPSNVLVDPPTMVLPPGLSVRSWKNNIPTIDPVVGAEKFAVACPVKDRVPAP